jgi:hypothetical protein
MSPAAAFDIPRIYPRAQFKESLVRNPVIAGEHLKMS